MFEGDYQPMLRFVSFASASAMMTVAAHAADPLLVIDQEQFEARYEAKPAVSGINGKIEATYNWYDVDNVDEDIDMWSGAGAISIPLGHSFGLQIDGGIGRYSAGDDSATGYGVAGHLFWRNPDTALVGLYGDYQRISDLDASTWRLGVEAELYFDRISLEGFAGAEQVSIDSDDETYFSGEALAALYVTDNFRIEGGVGHRFEEVYGTIGAEAMLPFGDNNVSLFTNAAFSEDATSVRGGVRIYFGEAGKSLKARHRQDDPKIRLFDPLVGDFFSAGDGESFPPPCNDCPY